MNLVIINGGSRPQSRTRNIAHYIKETAEKTQNFNVTFVDVADYQFEFDGHGKIPEYTEIVDKADAFFIVFPEYNHSFPGKLKTLLDSEFDLYKGKPVALCSVSNGTFGGARALEALLSVVSALNMVITNAHMHVPFVNEVLDDKGNVISEKVKENVNKTLQKLSDLKFS